MAKKLKSIECVEDYLNNRLTVENNIIDATAEDLGLVFNSWPESFDIVFDVGSAIFERLFKVRPHLVPHFQLDNINPKMWKDHPIMHKCVFLLQQKLYESLTKFWEDYGRPCAKRTHVFCESMQNFGAKYHRLVPGVECNDFIFMFDLLPEVHADVLSLYRMDGPLKSEEKPRFVGTWHKIINIIKMHFKYGWDHVEYKMTREEELVFGQVTKNLEASVSSPDLGSTQRRPRIIEKVVRLLSRDTLSEDDSAANTSITFTAVEMPGPEPNRIENSSSSITQDNNVPNERNLSAPIQIGDLNYDFTTSVRSSPIELKF